MSIVTLSRKTAGNTSGVMSSGRPAFSLNGGYRNQGYVGQTSLSRSLPRTLMRGAFQRGNGGLVGQFKTLKVPINTGLVSQENHDVIKKTVVGNNGHIHMKYRWVLRPAPYSTVKPDTNEGMNTQSSYIDIKKTKTLQCSTTKDLDTSPITNCNKCVSIMGGSKKKKYTATKPGIPTVDYSIYLRGLDAICGKLNTFTIANKRKNIPLPFT